MTPFVPSEQGRLGELLGKYAPRYGRGFQQKSQEAVKCFGAGVYLACCVMCGAASEAILLACATAKDGSETNVLKMYKSGSGRARVTSLLVGQAEHRLRNGVEKLVDLIAYYRDDSGHGLAVSFDSNEAFLAIATLLRYAAFVDDNWTALVSP